jgi:glycolate oxidase FAD binding subunit
LAPASHPLGDGHFARAVDRPETIEQLKEAVSRRASEGTAIYPQGGRTALDYGGIPGATGVAIDTTALNRVIDYPAADMTITVEAGITLEALRATLAEQTQRLAIEAPHPDRATLGGIFACNVTGPRRFGLGRPRDAIIGVGFVDGAGNLVKGGGRVVKNVAGYDLPKLLTGSLGTLGVICQLTLKVRPAPEATAIVWATYDRPEAVAEALDRLNTSATRPVALDLLNRPAAAHLGDPLGLPEAPWVLVVGFEEAKEAVAWQLQAVRSELKGAALGVVEGTEAPPLWSALTEFQAAGLGPVSFAATLRPSSVLRYVAAIDPGRWAIQAHAGNGIVLGHALGDWNEPEADAAIARLRDPAVADGGALTLPRCPTAWKPRLRVWGDPRPDWDLARRVKRALDPKGVMNPGRFVVTMG